MSWFTAITYTKYFNSSLDVVTRHGWSLSVEEHFYLFWPIIFVYFQTLKHRFALALVILVPIFRIIQFHYKISWIDDLSIFTRIDSIATGCLFALYKDKIIERIKSYWNLVFYFSIFILIFLRYFPRIASKVNLEFIFIPLGTTTGTISNIAIGFILLYSVFGPQNLWYRFLNLQLISYIGLLSYSIYLWQQIFTADLDYWIGKYPQNLLFILMMSLLSYYFIEKPFLKLKSKF